MMLYDKLEVEIKLVRKIRFMGFLIVLIFLLLILAHFKIYYLENRVTNLENVIEISSELEKEKG
jgi:hypothetical protein